MKITDRQTSCCRYCQHYTPEGRRGGQCSQLNVPVHGEWGACSLAVQAFAPVWEHPMEALAISSQVAPTHTEILTSSPVPSTSPTPVLV
ncbi:MAG: hypothetical protein ACRC8A_18740 [Microcoleaceae cyanobacterium]